jgi:drug/metabolite transporter (DMT)-like permease
MFRSPSIRSSMTALAASRTQLPTTVSPVPQSPNHRAGRKAGGSPSCQRLALPLLPRFVLSDNLRAALYMLLAMAAFVVNDSIVKLLTSDLPVPQLIAVRGVMATLLLGAIAWMRGVSFSPRILRQKLVMLRTFGDVTCTLLYITALGQLPLANAAAIFQALPLTVTLGAALFLREPVGWRRWSAIGVGFLGVLIIVRPGLEGFTAASLFVLAAVICAAIRDLSTRRLPVEVPSLLVSVVAALGVTVAAGLLVPATGWVPLTGMHVAMLAAAAVMIGVGYIFIVAAMRVGDMGFVAPFRYSVLLFALLIGIFWFDEIPDALVLLGSLIIVLSGAYTLYRERVNGIRPLPETEVV